MDEKVIPEQNRMGLAQALLVLYLGTGSASDKESALKTIFEYMDEMSLLHKHCEKQRCSHEDI